MRVIIYGAGKASQQVYDLTQELGVRVTKITDSWELWEQVQHSSERVVVIVLDSRHVGEAREAIGRTTYQVWVLLDTSFALQDYTRVGQHGEVNLRELLQG
jgi:hypothetical protein